MFGGDHPFSIPLSDLTSEELDQRYSTLMNRWHIARRMNMDQGVLHQLDLLLSSIETEREKRATVDDRLNGVILDTDPIQTTVSKEKRN